MVPSATASSAGLVLVVQTLERQKSQTLAVLLPDEVRQAAG